MTQSWTVAFRGSLRQAYSGHGRAKRAFGLSLLWLPRYNDVLAYRLGIRFNYYGMDIRD